MTKENNTIIKKICPECKHTNCTKEDYIHAETYCKYCGLVLKAPPVHGIIFPGLQIIKIKKKKEED